MDTLTQASQNTSLTLQGCGYKVDNDRVIISIQRIANDRAEGNLSGTLRLQLCALLQDSNRSLEEVILASTTIGEIKGQHFLIDCHYDLLFQQPPEGTWQFALQLSEWDGMDYVLCDSAYFNTYYQVEANPAFLEPVITAVVEPIDEHQEESEAATAKEQTEQTEQTIVEQKTVKKNAIGYADGYLAINKSKVEKLLNIKGVQKKVLERLVAERPFPSEKAVLNVKGMGPAMLKKILTALIA